MIMHEATVANFINNLSKNMSELINFLTVSPEHEEILFDLIERYNTPSVIANELRKYRLDTEHFEYDIDNIKTLMHKEEYMEIHRILNQIFLEPFNYRWFNIFIKKGKNIVDLLKWHEQYPTKRFAEYFLN